MENPLMDNVAVASFIGGISPRTATGLMRTMPCINVSNGDQRKRLRVYQSDLEKWLESRKFIRSASPARNHQKPAGKKNPRGEGLDENGFVLKRHTR